MDTKKDLMERALVEMNANKELRFNIDVSMLDLISVIGALQLALRHPKYTGPSASVVKSFIDQTMPLFDRMPGIQEGIKSEDDPYPGWKLRKRARKPL